MQARAGRVDRGRRPRASPPRSAAPTPTATASRSPPAGPRTEELLALCEVVEQHPGTTLEAMTDGCLDRFSDDEIELFSDMSATAKRPLNWNVLTIDSREPARIPRQLSAGDRGRREGRAHRGPHPAGAGAHEHELPQPLRAVPDPRLEGRARPAGARAHRRAAEARGAGPHAGAGPVARGRRVQAPRRLRELHHRRHLLRGQRGPEGPPGRRARRRAGPGRRSPP